MAVKVPAAGGHLEASGQALQVPLERPGKGLVEVVDVEEELPLGGGEPAEVRQVGVAAQLHDDARVRSSGEVGGHRQGGATVVGEGRGGHAGVADRYQFGHPGLGLLSQELERFERPLARMPLGQLLPR